MQALTTRGMSMSGMLRSKQVLRLLPCPAALIRAEMPPLLLLPVGAPLLAVTSTDAGAVGAS
jgi:hypothetical protein